MPDTVESESQQALRVSKAVGLPVSKDPSANGRAIVLVSDLDGQARTLAEKPGTFLYLPGWEKPKFGEVIVPLDGTASAEAILPYAVRVSQAEAADIRLIVRRGDQYVLTGTPSERYVKVLVNTMREQHLQVRGQVVEGDLLAAAGAAAQKAEGLVVASARGSQGTKDYLFASGARERLQGAPLLLFSPH